MMAAQGLSVYIQFIHVDMAIRVSEHMSCHVRRAKRATIASNTLCGPTNQISTYVITTGGQQQLAVIPKPSLASTSQHIYYTAVIVASLCLCLCKWGGDLLFCSRSRGRVFHWRWHRSWGLSTGGDVRPSCTASHSHWMMQCADAS